MTVARATAGLVTAPNIRDADGFYAALLSAHKGLTREDSEALNARLVLILANHVGDNPVLVEAIALARRTGTADA